MALSQSTCLIGGVAPWVIPIKDNRVGSGNSALTKGVAVTISSNPNQLFSLRPITTRNNTFVPGPSACSSPSNDTCVAGYGGIYNPPAGVNKTNDAGSWNGTASGRPGSVGNVYYNDLLRIASHDFPGAPFFSYQQSGYSGFPSALALGQNSSLLDAALMEGIIPSKQWSFAPFDDSTYDGGIIIGGYDSDRPTTAFQTYDVDVNGYLALEITGLAFEYSAGNLTSLMPNDTKRFKAVVEPYYDFISLPSESIAKFATATNGTYNSSVASGYTYNYPYYPRGNLVITFSDGQTTNISTDVLIDYQTYYDTSGTLYQSYDTEVSRLRDNYYDNTFDTNNPYYYLGLPFLAQKYLVTDYDAGVFHLAGARIPDAYTVGYSPSKLVPLCQGGPLFNSNGSATPGKPPNSTVSSGGGGGTNVAAIAGGVGGGVGGLIIIGLIAFFVLRRRNKHKKQSQQEISQVQQTHQNYPDGPERYSHPHAYGDAYDRGLAASPPPKSPVVYEATGSQLHNNRASDGRYGGELASSPTLNPHSDGDWSSSGGATGTNRNTYVERPTDVPTMSATSGPFEMPHDDNYRD